MLPLQLCKRRVLLKALQGFQLNDIRVAVVPVARTDAPAVVGLRRCRSGAYPRHYCFCNDLLASLSGAPRPRLAPDRQPFFPFLAMAHDGYGDQGMGCHTPQA